MEKLLILLQMSRRLTNKNGLIQRPARQHFHISFSEKYILLKLRIPLSKKDVLLFLIQFCGQTEGARGEEKEGLSNV